MVDLQAAPTATAIPPESTTNEDLHVTPDVLELRWVSESAREVWSPRLQRISKASREIGWLSVAAGIRPCQVELVPPEDYVSLASRLLDHGLCALPMEAQANESPAQTQIQLAIGLPIDVIPFARAWTDADDHTVGRLLGWPDCCREAYRKLWVESGQEDPTWPMVAACDASSAGTGIADISAHPATNVMWRMFDARAVPHVPCRVDCAASEELARRYAALWQKSGFGQELAWLYEVLGWSVGWSGEKGIATLRTPILTLTMRTDASAPPREVRVHGSGDPVEGTEQLISSQRNPQERARPQPATRRAGAATPPTVEQGALQAVLDLHGASIANLNVREICTADYLTAVELTDGSQGVGLNLFNVYGPHRTPYNPQHYDSLLLRLCKGDPLLRETFLSVPHLDLLGQSVKIAILNALSTKLLDPDRLRGEGLAISDGLLDIAPFLQKSDTVGMIGCLGNYTSWRVGEVAHIRRVLFSDFEYVEPFKKGMEDFVQRTFRYPEKVILSDGTKNRAICERSDVVILNAATLCTDTLDELLEWSRNARDVLLVGRDYAMDPRVIFDKGVTGLTTQVVVQPNIVSFVKEKLKRREFGLSQSLKNGIRQMSVTRIDRTGSQDSVKEAVPRVGPVQISTGSKLPVKSDTPASGQSDILEAALTRLRASHTVSDRRITDLCLGNYFTVAELDDGSVGACMSYYKLPAPLLAAIEERLALRREGDPLLLRALFDQEAADEGDESSRLQERLVAMSLRATIVSALSAPVLRNGGDATFLASEAPPFDPFARMERALVVGFGGYMDQLARLPHVKQLHVVDLGYGARKKEMDLALSLYRQESPGKEITISDGHDTARWLQTVDVVSITGSALCNGTMDQILSQARGHARIIVQGQSASIHPEPLFNRGVDLVATTLKPRSLVQLARADVEGSRLRGMLEGGLPVLYLTPRP